MEKETEVKRSNLLCPQSSDIRIKLQTQSGLGQSPHSPLQYSASPKKVFNWNSIFIIQKALISNNGVV